MAGGIAVVCGHGCEDRDQLLGYRPLVGMVGGMVYVRGGAKGYSTKDAKEVELSNEDWDWLSTNLETFLTKINKKDLLEELSRRSDWKLFACKTPRKKPKGETDRPCPGSENRSGTWNWAEAA